MRKLTAQEKLNILKDAEEQYRKTGYVNIKMLAAKHHRKIIGIIFN